MCVPSGEYIVRKVKSISEDTMILGVWSLSNFDRLKLNFRT